MFTRTSTSLLTTLALTAAACGTSASGIAEAAEPITEPIAQDVHYGADVADGHTLEPELDVWAPADTENAPVLIILDGAPPWRPDTEEIALALAGRGFVVLNADWQLDPDHLLATGAHYQAACLVRYARANAERLGGDPGRVIIVGYSAGGSLASLLAPNGDAVQGQGEQDESLSPVPDAFIGLAGGYEYLVLDSPEPGFGAHLFAVDSQRWAMLNPYEHLDAASDVDALLIHGDSDWTVSPGSTERFGSALESRGADVTIHLIEETGHDLVSEPAVSLVVDHIADWMALG